MRSNASILSTLFKDEGDHITAHRHPTSLSITFPHCRGAMHHHGHGRHQLATLPHTTNNNNNHTLTTNTANEKTKSLFKHPGLRPVKPALARRYAIDSDGGLDRRDLGHGS
eukprot:2641895-Rhodomonas_salina.1